MVVDQTRYIASLDGKMSDEEKATIADLETKRNEIRKLDPKDSRTSGLMMNLPAAYWLSLRGYDPVVAATKLTMPLLILQGERDYQISIKTDFPRWRNAFAHNPKTRLNTYPALNHLFISGSGRPTPEEYQQEGHVDATVVSDIANWVLKETSH
jgi:pimeloyl-ACP methyl ester carboxylesterase